MEMATHHAETTRQISMILALSRMVEPEAPFDVQIIAKQSATAVMAYVGCQANKSAWRGDEKYLGTTPDWGGYRANPPWRGYLYYRRLDKVVQGCSGHYTCKFNLPTSRTKSNLQESTPAYPLPLLKRIFSIKWGT